MQFSLDLSELFVNYSYCWKLEQMKDLGHHMIHEPVRNSIWPNVNCLVPVLELLADALGLLVSLGHIEPFKVRRVAGFRIL